MSATITIVNRRAAGNRFIREGTGNLGVYATGGIAVTKSQFELPASLKDLEVRNAGGYSFEIISLTDAGCTIKAYDEKDPGAAGGADIADPQVGNTIDLSAVTFRFVASGH